MNKNTIAPLVSAVCLLTSHFGYAGSATWNLDPSTDDWNTATNWSPATVPNGASDTAAFETSNKTSVTLSDTIELHDMVFNPDASAFMLSSAIAGIDIDGRGLVNNSAVIQQFLLLADPRGMQGWMVFHNNSTVGSNLAFELQGASASSVLGGYILFQDHSNAGNGSFNMTGATNIGDEGGRVWFSGNATAGNATFVCGGSRVFPSNPAIVQFNESSRAATSTITVYGSDIANGIGARANFFGGSKADNATLIAYGTYGDFAAGSIYFADAATGGNARVELFGAGFLDISFLDHPTLFIGSLEGNGAVRLGASELAVGRNDLDTIFSGEISGDGSISKVGAGRLFLRGESSYLGGTHIERGKFFVANQTGSATGAGTVFVDGGHLAGTGIIEGKVIVGTGSGRSAAIRPGLARAASAVLTIQSTLVVESDGQCQLVLNSDDATAGGVVAHGISIASGANVSFEDTGTLTLDSGTTFTLIDNRAATPISGTFGNLADGSSITVGSNTYQANYEGGDGNDLTLTVVP